MAADPATGRPDAAGEPDAGVLSGPDLAGRVVRGGAVRTVAFGVVNLLGVASSIILLRYLGVSDFGRYGTVVAIVGIASGLADVGLNLTGSRELALMPAGPQRRQLLGALLGARLLLLAVAVLGAIVFAALAGYGSAIVAGTALAGAGAILIGLQSTLMLPLVVDLRNGLLSVNEVFKQLILFAGVVVLAAVGATLTSFFAVQLLVGVCAVLAVPLLISHSELAWPSLSRADLHHIAFTALPVALAAILTTFYMRMLVVISSLLTTEYQTGLFVTSARIVEMIGGLAMLVSGVLLPVATVAARDDRPRFRYVLAHTTKLAMLGGGLLALLVVVGARPIVLVLGGSQFEGAVGVLQLQGPVVLSTFLIYACTTFMIADGRRRALVGCMVIGTVTLLVAGFALISVLDAHGAALAAATADVVLAGSALIAIRRLNDGQIGLGSDYLLRYVAVLAIAGGIAVLVMLVAPDAVAAVVAGLLFVGGATVLRIVPSELTALIPRR